MEEAHKALVSGNQTHSDSHSLWLMRLRSERSGERGEEEEEGGEGEKGKGASTETLIQLCSEAVEKVPAEVKICT